MAKETLEIELIWDIKMENYFLLASGPNIIFINERGRWESVIQRKRCDDCTRYWSHVNAGLEGRRGL